MNDRGSVSFFVYFAYLAIILLVLFAIIIPILQQFNTQVYASAENILVDGNTIAGNITDAGIRTALQDNFSAQADSIVTQIDILGTFFQYSWLIIILVLSLAFFIITRQSVEVGIR